MRARRLTSIDWNSAHAGSSSEVKLGTERRSTSCARREPFREASRHHPTLGFNSEIPRSPATPSQRPPARVAGRDRAATSHSPAISCCVAAAISNGRVRGRRSCSLHGRWCSAVGHSNRIQDLFGALRRSNSPDASVNASASGHAVRARRSSDADGAAAATAASRRSNDRR